MKKPGIVFAHGLWADGSCFQKLIPALQATETSQSLQQKFPVTEVFSHIEVADGRIWLKQPGGIGSFAGDLPEAEQKLVWATQAAPVPDLFNQKVDGVA